MFKSVLAAGMFAGGLFAFSPAASAAVVVPPALSGAEEASNIVQVGRRGHGHFRGFAVGGRKFHGGHHFRHGGIGRRHFRGFGHRHFAYGGWKHRHHRHHRRHRHFGGWPFIYGALPFIGYGAYSYGYYGRRCGWLWRKYRYTGSYYWYRRWRECRYYW